FLVGSESQARLQSNDIRAEINWDTLHQQMLIRTFFQYDLDTTLVKNVHSLPLGHFMIVKPGGQFKVEKYWDLPDTTDKHDASEKQLAEELKELMETSVKYRLVSDVPVASFLSGGMDSSVLSVLASRLVKDYKLTVITVKYEGGGKDFYSGAEDQDLKYSRIVADTIKDKIVHKIITVKPTDITVEALDNISDLAILNDDERFLTIHGNYRVVQKEGFKVVLNGEGADEIMGGYVGLNTVYNGIYDIHRPTEDIIRNGFRHLVLADPGNFSGELLGQVDKVYENLHNHFHGYPGDLLEKTHRFFACGILQRILRMEDHVSMDSSVECRVPFLDHNVVEWCFRVPFQKHIQVPDRMGKMLLRKAAKGYFPDEVIIRPKQAFPAPSKTRTEEVLKQIYQDNHSEITNSDVIRRIYKKDILKSSVPQVSYRELWLMLIAWRWEEKLKAFKT
ncbi:MAG: asparagine synthase, partial [bacterium]|nr:asparagine synthase [bacterium]